MDATFPKGEVDHVARALIGVTLLVDGVGGVIVETEAYDAGDPASHSFAGPTARNAAMFGAGGAGGAGGAAYVYRIYGLHHCLNVTCGDGAAVLIRALEPTHGVETMVARRGKVRPVLLCAGPGRLCAALGVDRDLDGAPLDRAPFAWIARHRDPEVSAGPRIGISRATDTAWRFTMRGSPFLSRPAAT